MVDRRASSRPGDSYLDDGYYRPIEAPLEKKMGLPDGLLSRIRKDGERTNRNQVSSAGARSVYQIIPPTAALFRKKYGVNAYANDQAAATVTALHLKESWDRSDGNLEQTVREYHGGPNQKNWGRINDAYARRILGQATARTLTTPTRGTTVLASGVDLSNVDVAALRNVAPADIGSRRPLGPRPITEREIAPKPTAAGAILSPYLNQDATPGSDVATAREQRQAQTRATQIETERSSVTAGERVEAALDRNWIVSMIGRAADTDLHEGDPNWHKEYLRNIDQYEANAQSQDELDEYRSSRAQNSREDFFAVQQGIEQRRRSQEIVDSNGTGWAYDLAASATDPVGWAATMGVSKGIAGASAFAKGAKALLAGPGLGAMAVEGAGVNMGFTAMMDASGDQQSVSDYVTSGVMGLGIGVALHGLTTRLGKPDVSDSALGAAHEKNTRATIQEIEEAAQAKAGPDADSSRLEEARQEVVRDRTEQAMRMAVSQRPDVDRFMPLDPDLARTSDAAAAKQVIDTHGLGRMANEGDQRIGAEILHRSTEIASRARAAGELDKGLEGKFLKFFGQESDALTLIRSKNPVMQAVGIQLLEATTGAGGVKSSAAISMHMLQKNYMSHLIDLDQAYSLWRRGEGKGKLAEVIDGESRREFDQLVFREVEARSADSPILTSNNAVRKAADAWEAGMDKMRRHSQEIGTAGNERLGKTSVGYMIHKIDPRKLMNLDKPQLKAVQDIMAVQFQKLNDYSFINKEGEKITKNFDAAFSKDLARRYLDEAIGRGKGSNFIPANLHSSESASIVSDTLEAMQGLSTEEREAILGRFSRGGPSYTKGRLNFDLSADIGKGMQLGDLFNQDLTNLYRSYATRTAGEVALAQYGILGKDTLKIMRHTAEASGATIPELHAFERITSEFMNEPWHRAGPGQQKVDNAFKNLRSVTAAAQLGGMGITQLGEQGNAIAALGVRRALSIIPSFNRLNKEVGMFQKGLKAKNPIIGDLDEIYGFVGGDEFAMTRLFDAPESNVQLYDAENIGVISKVARGGAHFTAVMSGFRTIHAVQQRGLAEQIVRKAVRYIQLGEHDVALAGMGINEEIRGAFKANMDKIATFDKKGNLTGLDLFSDHDIHPRIIQDFAQTIERGAGQIIQKTFIGETGPWAHNEFLKLLLQFRGFGVTSIEKQFGRNRANYGAIKSFGILVGAMGFALPIHYARLQAKSIGMSRSEREKFLDENTQVGVLTNSVMKYTSSSGLLPDFLDVMSTFGAKVGHATGHELPTTISTVGADPRGKQAGLTSMIPSLGYADRAVKGTLGGDFKQLPKLLPGANLPYVIPIINGLTESK